MPVLVLGLYVCAYTYAHVHIWVWTIEPRANTARLSYTPQPQKGTSQVSKMLVRNVKHKGNILAKS